jgi:UDP-2,4-diacetamido-2,4,6-trideoxy-beta-L-altropyranose hydrolase
MRAVIRVDASFEIGTGHVMRCLTLARSLRATGANVSFICREDSGHLCNVIDATKFHCSRLPKWPVECQSGEATPNAAIGIAAFRETDAWQTRAVIQSFGGNPDLLVVDHYMLDKSWESVLRPNVGRIFVIDDLANREHDCDILLDQNLHDLPNSRYSGLVPEGAQVFLGPRYALLRPEFDSAPAIPRTNGLRRMLVFFGGVDSTNEALKIIQALCQMGSSAPETGVVLGPANPHLDSVLSAASGAAGINVLRQTEDMARLMREADLGIGTCGMAAWERCSVGLPSLVVISADNQRDDARILHAMGAARSLGDAVNASIEQWAAEIQDMRKDPALLNAMSYAAAAVMRGRSEAMRDLEAALVS